MNEKKVVRKIGETENMDIAIAVIPKGQELTMEDIYKAFPYIKEAREREAKEKVLGGKQI